MKAIQVDGKRLVWVEVATPDLGPGQVRIKVHASAINRADLLQRQGGYAPPPGASSVMGLECAGEVMAVGEGVERVKQGDAVCALLAGGGYAEEVVAPAGQVLKVPKGLTMAQAASIPEVYATAYLNLYMEAGLKTAERVLLHAGASGVGTAAIQLCRQTSNPVYVTVGSDAKIKACEALGAAAGFNRKNGSFADTLAQWAGAQWAGEGGFDVILDPVGGGYLADNLKVLNLDGRLVVIGLMGGMSADVNLGLMLGKRLRIIGSTLRARTIAAKAAIMDGLRADLWPHLESGAIKPIIETVIPIEETERAHELLAGNDTIGKVVLEVIKG
ncbi:MAG: NAD(P)H-quinone oxidoreductase [Proteobacteria bacterium]|nr:NAD(P)H-quinone oxidoreductase [Pseudomonadota bacterium]